MQTTRQTWWLARDGFGYVFFRKPLTRGNWRRTPNSSWRNLVNTTRNPWFPLTRFVARAWVSAVQPIKPGECIEIEVRAIGKPQQIGKAKP